jgi:hypothetical protein
MQLRLVALAFMAAVASTALSHPAAADTVSDILGARSSVERGDWKDAIAPLQRLVAQSPANGEFRLSLARARYNTGDFAGAGADYKIAFDLKAEDPAMAAYGIARCEARLNHTQNAIAWLGTAVSLGLRRLEEARTLDDFATLKDNPDFRKLVGLPPATPPSRDDGWRGDIRFLANWVERKSIHPFKTTTGDRTVSGAQYTQAEFESRVQTLIANVPKMSDGEIEVGLFRLVASLGDGHTTVLGSHTRMEFAMTLPLGFYAFDDGFTVISAAPKYAGLVGAKVVAIDGVPIATALAKLDDTIAHDNKTWLKTMEPNYFRHVPFLKALGIAKAENGADLTLAGKDGATETVHIDADATQPDIWNSLPKPAGWTWIADKSAAPFQRDNDKHYWWDWNAESRILYVQYNKVADGEKQSLADFAAELSKAIVAHAPDKLVIDMRNNNGGDTYLNEPFLGAVAASSVNRAGHLYVIIGRRTFSAAENAVSYFGRFTKAIFVGEPTGGKPNAPGDETPFTLPYSAILVNLSDRYWQGSWPDDFSDFRAPDISTPESFSDYAAGRDTAMDAIRAQSSPAD